MNLIPLLNASCGDVDNSPSSPHLHSYYDDYVPLKKEHLYFGISGTFLLWVDTAKPSLNSKAVKDSWDRATKFLQRISTDGGR